VEEYNLGDNPDVLFSFADALYSNFRWADCFTITSRYAFVHLSGLLNLTPMIGSLVLFLFTTKLCPCILHACTIFLISILNSLFWRMRWSTGSRKILLAGMRLECGISVVENGPKRDSISGKNISSPLGSQIDNSLAISKTSLMDPRFGPAWVAFGHTFALEGEHDHAVTAYSTCARMFTG